MNAAMNRYTEFKVKRGKLYALSQREAKVLQSLGLQTWVQTMAGLQERLRSETFQVLVIGEFNHGKSTFINALLRETVLPSDPRPYTALINEVKWAEQKRTVVHYKQNADGKPAKPPHEIPVDKLAEYVSVNYEQGSDPDAQVKSSPYETVEVFWPLPLCRDGVVIIDSPGLNANDAHERITLDYLERTDAVVFMLSAGQPMTKKERDMVLQEIKPHGHESIFFVYNKFDLIRPGDRDRVRSYGTKVASELTESGSRYVFMISAQQALDGYTGGNTQLVEQSGIRPLEQALERFLTDEWGNQKLRAPAREMIRALNEALAAIPQQEAMLNMDLKQLEERVAKAKEPLDTLERQREQMLHRIQLFLAELKADVRDQVISFYSSVINRVPEWTKEIETDDLGFTDMLRLKQAITRVSTQVQEKLGQRVEAEFESWLNTSLKAYLAKRLERLQQELDEKARAFVEQRDAIQVQLGNRPKVDIGLAGQREIPLWERILSAAGGWALGGVGAGMLGGVFGFSEMLKGLIPQLVVVAVAVALAGLNPLVLIPAVVGSALFQGRFALGSTTRKIKEETAKAYVQGIRENSNRASTEVAARVVAKLEQFKNAVSEGLGNEIKSVREQADVILRDKRSGEAAAQQKQQVLKNARQELMAINQELNDLLR